MLADYIAGDGVGLDQVETDLQNGDMFAKAVDYVIHCRICEALGIC